MISSSTRAVIAVIFNMNGVSLLAWLFGGGPKPETKATKDGKNIDAMKGLQNLSTQPYQQC